jgi:diketogulonate reductase-like aldo/keto reductase
LSALSALIASDPARSRFSSLLRRSWAPPSPTKPRQVSLRWAIEHGVCVIPKAERPNHQLENLQLFDFRLSADEMAALDGLSAHRSVYRFCDPDKYA